LRGFVKMDLKLSEEKPLENFRKLKDEKAPEVLKVSSKSTPNSVAGAIAGVIREQKCVEVQSIGAGATNQAIKAITVARGFLAPAGVDLACTPAFGSAVVEGEERTTMKLTVFAR